MTTRQTLRYLRARIAELEAAVEEAHARGVSWRRCYEIGVAEGRRQEQEIHRETWYADRWTEPPQRDRS